MNDFTYMYDTSALLAGAYKNNCVGIISPIVLQELESIKTSALKSDEIKIAARTFLRYYLSNDNKIQMFSTNLLELKKIKFKFRNHLNDNNDSLIICYAIAAAKQYNNLILITSDVLMYEIAKGCNLLCEYYSPIDGGITLENIYKGWHRENPTAEQFNALYSMQNTENFFNCSVNEYVQLYEDDVLKDMLRWNGKFYQKLKFNNFMNYFNERVKPRNPEQRMLFDLLQDDSIKIKLCMGGFGDGKTYCMLQHALQGVRDGKFSKIVFVRNNIEVKGSKPIGFLGGTLIDKIRPYIEPIADLTTTDYLDQLIETGQLEPVPLGFCRGRDWSNDTLVFVDEAENLTVQNVQLLIGRIGEGSQIWFAGDLKQIDHHTFAENNGLKAMTEKLRGDPLFGMVKLIKSERSATAMLADKLD